MAKDQAAGIAVQTVNEFVEAHPGELDLAEWALFDDDGSFIIEFTMPDHNTEVHMERDNSMTAMPVKKEQEKKKKRKQMTVHRRGYVRTAESWFLT